LNLLFKNGSWYLINDKIKGENSFEIFPTVIITDKILLCQIKQFKFENKYEIAIMPHNNKHALTYI